MKQTVKSPTKGKSLKKETKSANLVTFSQKELSLKEGTTAKGLILKMQRDARKATNEARQNATKDERNERKKLSYNFKQLQNFAVDYVALLSKETGKTVTVADIQKLRYSDFLPFLTEREELANLTNGWTFSRLLLIVSRYYRNERKEQIKDSLLSFESMDSE